MRMQSQIYCHLDLCCKNECKMIQTIAFSTQSLWKQGNFQVLDENKHKFLKN